MKENVIENLICPHCYSNPDPVLKHTMWVCGTQYNDIQYRTKECYKKQVELLKAEIEERDIITEQLDKAVFGKRFAVRCNDYIETLPLWKRLVQVILRVHRENGSGQHQISPWKVKILSRIIKPAPQDSNWIWINTK